MRNRVLTVAFVGLASWHGIATSEPGYVIVDASEKHATTYISLPKAIPQDKLQEIRGKIAAVPGAYLETWAAFNADLQRHVLRNIRKNEYPEVETAEELVALLGKLEGASIGLTWNGGFALTYNDYMHAQRTYARFAKDPAFVARPADRRADPVNPGNHTEPLLRQ